MEIKGINPAEVPSVNKAISFSSSDYGTELGELLGNNDSLDTGDSFEFTSTDKGTSKLKAELEKEKKRLKREKNKKPPTGSDPLSYLERQRQKAIKGKEEKSGIDDNGNLLFYYE